MHMCNTGLAKDTWQVCSIGLVKDTMRGGQLCLIVYRDAYRSAI